ncbi:peptidase M24, structural domain-containing protein [Pyronema domesticum]|uniref:Xaa-Pro aminopeptidase n=1 Tax=Pyronema omphalodes (strain CBS 100304) TaxID=1076935 RepID=U4KV82_PYROM|nr:peptidase M24, structural domain-containing protein [Pyronema domesticum]CCX05127.1 Similar to Uncharacterized peptidase C12B10.05; acc. no. Q10439 [Pyronema omphalodes CBS 100304]
MLRPATTALRRALFSRPLTRVSTIPTSFARRTYATVPKPVRLGQPTHETHPHYLNAGEITPGIDALEYSLRRAQLASHLPEGGVAIIPSSTTKYRSGPVFYEFHQSPDFFYLTGFLEPDSCAVIQKTGPDGQHNFYMFVREKDAHAELWDGARTGTEGAKEFFNADEAWDSRYMGRYLAPIVEEAKVVVVDVPKGQEAASVQSFFGVSAPSTVTDLVKGKVVKPLKGIMHQMRVVKSGTEAAVMRKAGKFSGRAYQRAMREDFETEKELADFLEYEFKRHGCDKSAYVPVVAGGENALSIHYTFNDEQFKDGDLVLVDAGGQYGGYVTDITRTWPVNGRFSPAQKDLYSAVLTVQRNCVKMCREDANMSLDDIHHQAEIGLRDELGLLGFDLTGGVLGNILFPHHVGHYVGIDLHDVGSFGRVQKLKQGHVVTIEPGVYVPDDERWPKHFRGMGIRVEDSVYVGETNPIVLTAEAPKEIEDIEALRD